MNEMQPDNDSSSHSTTTEAAAKPKRVRRPNHRRPKMLPSATRQRLGALGFQPKSYDTTDTNLNELMERMTSDLQRYTIAADHWQAKLQELRAKEAEPSDPSKASSGAANASNLDGLGNPHGLPSNSPLSAWEHDMLSRLKRVSDPTLEMITLPDPRVRSGISTSFLSSPSSELYFNRVLDNVAAIAGVFGVHTGNGGKWDAISRLKPNFSERRARRVWADVFAPIEASVDSFHWEGAPSSRRSSPHTYKYSIESGQTSPSSSSPHYASYESSSISRSSPRYIDPDDSDYDHMDRKLAALSDEAVIDMLHYSSLMIIGFNHSSMHQTEKLYQEARDHLGKNCERLLRELIFTRNASCDSRSAQGLLAGMIGILRYFSAMQRTGAVLSMMEIAWQMAMNHVTEVHPIMKGLISFISTVMAPNPSRRAVWMARNQENYQSTSERYFHLCTTAYFAAAYYALSNRDEDTLLHYLAQLDDVLAPNSEPNGNEAYRDPECCFQFSEEFELDDEDYPLSYLVPSPTSYQSGVQHGTEATFSILPQYGPSPHQHQQHNQPQQQQLHQQSTQSTTQHIHHPSCTHYQAPSYDPQGANSENYQSSSMCDGSQCSTRVRYTYPRASWPAPSDADGTLPATAGRNFSILMNPPGYEYDYMHDSRSPSSDTPNSMANNYLSASTDPTYMLQDQAFAMPSNLYGCSDSDTEEITTVPTYTPSEDFKAILRSATHLIRAEGALMANDYTTCMQWMDEAEKEIKTVPDLYLDHKVFIVDVSALKSVFVAECPFPTGSRSIAAEFERRLEEETKRRQKKAAQMQQLQASIIQ